jgi:CDP-diacylglycerol--serine O-phosphatidyltransferase
MTAAQPAPRTPRRPLRRMILARTAALPVLVTLLNGVAGFAAIHYATKAGLHTSTAEELAKKSMNLSIAAWLIFAAMFFDALDGRIARMTRQATDFGAQLDSLCDAVSFGVAPAVLMVHSVAVTREVEDFEIFLAHPSLGKVVMAIAVIYACCAVLRLARFNVENAPDLLHHLSFRGLPSPAAAALVAAMVLLFDMLLDLEKGRWLKVTIGVALPAFTAVAAGLMVSRFRYPHLINRFLAGKKRFGTIVMALVLLVAGLMFRRQMLALAALAYAASGPAAAFWKKVRPRREAQARR